MIHWKRSNGNTPTAVRFQPLLKDLPMGAACFWWQATKINVATGILCECTVCTYIFTVQFFNICIVLCIFTVYIYTVFIHIYYTHETTLAVSKTSERALLLNISSHIHRGAPTFGYELSWFLHGPCSKNVLGGSLVHLASALGFLGSKVPGVNPAFLIPESNGRMRTLLFFWTSSGSKPKCIPFLPSWFSGNPVEFSQPFKQSCHGAFHSKNQLIPTLPRHWLWIISRRLCISERPLELKVQIVRDFFVDFSQTPGPCAPWKLETFGWTFVSGSIERWLLD